MKKHYAFLSLVSICLLLIIFACSKSEDDDYVPVPPPVATVKVDLTKVPYPKLSDYNFFIGDIKDQKPADGLLPFQPASALFTDYALKKRFVWMPKDTKATYNTDQSILELPVGAALVKTFYYDNVQNISPVGGTRVIETRVMIRKADGWIFADYIWNAEQTEAFYSLDGSFTPISWKDANNVIKSTDYRIPSEAQCIVCHKSRQSINGADVTKYIPIGIKPQNLNFEYDYGTAVKNQLTKWIEQGYLESSATLPTVENTTVNYNDTSKPLAVRARSYIDANCAHCHQTDRHCDYRPMRFAFSETGAANGLTNLGVCVNTQDMQGFPAGLNKIVAPGNVNRSMLYYRLNTTNETYRMPLHGRTVIHDEALVLIGAWINSLERCQ